LSVLTLQIDMASKRKTVSLHDPEFDKIALGWYSELESDDSDTEPNAIVAIKSDHESSSEESYESEDEVTDSQVNIPLCEHGEDNEVEEEEAEETEEEDSQ
jgi:hypothetical protein